MQRLRQQGLREVIRIRAADNDDLAEHEAIVEVYKQASGLPPLPRLFLPGAENSPADRSASQPGLLSEDRDMTHHPAPAPFFRRDRAPRVLTYDDYVKIAKVSPQEAVEEIAGLVATGRVKRCFVKGDIAILTVVRETVAA